jgi:hypothetical protein
MHHLRQVRQIQRVPRQAFADMCLSAIGPWQNPAIF